MVLSRIYSVAFLGLDAVVVEVEVDVDRSEKPSAVIVGLPDAAVKEAKIASLEPRKIQGVLLEACVVRSIDSGDLKKKAFSMTSPLHLA